MSVWVVVPYSPDEPKGPKYPNGRLLDLQGSISVSFSFMYICIQICGLFSKLLAPFADRLYSDTEYLGYFGGTIMCFILLTGPGTYHVVI